jgi:hypothetical protein
VVSSGDVRKLKITPTTDTSTVEVLAGKGGTDALAALGLKEGIVRKTKTRTARPSGRRQGQDLRPAAGRRPRPHDADGRQAATLAELTTALSAVRTVYRDLETAAKPQTRLTDGRGTVHRRPVPAYLTNQIANYQAALNRLTGGG